jgi:hypothetical protein
MKFLISILALFAFSFAAGAAPLRAVVFFADGFPAADAPEPKRAVLEQALASAGPGLDAAWASDPVGLGSQLQDASCRLLILPYGSAFPVDSWADIKSFLGRGGNLLVLGGAPFHQPIRHEKGQWVQGFRQPTFAGQLLIGPAEEIAVKPNWAAEIANVVALDSPPSRTWALTVRFASTKDFQDEDGGAGVREAILRPLARLADSGGVPRACAVQEIDRLRGEWAGGRWVFATTDADIGAETIKKLIERAAAGPCEFEARVLPASLETGEKPRVRVFLRRPLTGEPAPLRANFKLIDSAGQVRGEQTLNLGGSASLRTAEAVFETRRALAPGLYTIKAEVLGAGYQVPAAATGVWVKDSKLLQTGPRWTAGRDWLKRGGVPTPVVGTTYMDSQIHRKFLFEPNPQRWSADFAAMRRAGINYVRTGIWTGWSRIGLEPGSLDENVLRALDAYIQSAASNNIHVCFTFFAFLPTAAQGDNPYLHPRALEGQKAFLTLIADRYKGSPWVHYDLINEPSYSAPAQLWSTRPIGDVYERRAWREHLIKRYGDSPAAIADIFRDGEDPFALPRPRDFAYASLRQGRAPRKAAEFYRFANEIIAQWAASLRDTIRQAGGDVMVTLGQDEGGISGRPGPAFFGGSVDYTTVHSWWNNDDLLWDSLAAKIPEKPCLSQETGLMRLEDKDGMPWRGIPGSAALLERKFALSFLGRGAGAVQWAWNINTDMDNDNEAVIGIFRPDGTAKPEYDVVRSFGDFASKAAPFLDDWDDDDVAVLIPHQRIWLGRLRGDEGARRIVKLLADRFGTVGRLVSDQLCTAKDLEGMKLVVVPTSESLSPQTEAALQHVIASGGVVLALGPIEGNFGGGPLSVLKGLQGQRPLSNRENTPWGWATFDQTLNQSLRAGIASFDMEKRGEAKLWHEGLPLDYAREEAPLANLLGMALKAAGIQASFQPHPAAARVLKNNKVHLAGVVNESSREASRNFIGENYNIHISALPGRSALSLIDAATGKALAVYAPPEID